MKSSLKRILLLALALVMVLSCTVVGASAESKGKIMILSNLSSGIQYEFYKAYYEMICQNLGYEFVMVYGDPFNDPAGNLNAVKNAYTSDVKGLIAAQDGGIKNIMDEYPDLYVVGFYSDMDAIYNEDGAAHDLLNNPHYLGCMGDNFISGEDLGKAYAEEVIARGYKKVATAIFPVYAYPKHTVADAAFRAAIEAHNATAAEPIEIAGEATVLNFSPLETSFFMEDVNQGLDAIVGFCAGTTFLYPTVSEAKAMGMCSENLQLVTGGFDNDPDLFANCGDDKTIVRLTIAAGESALWQMAMLDAALSGTMYPDYTTPDRYDSAILVINSTEKFQAIQNNSPLGLTLDLSKAQTSWDAMKDYFITVNPGATYKALTDYCRSFTVEGYIK